MSLLESLEGGFKDGQAIPYDRSNKTFVEAINSLGRDVKKIAKAFDEHYHTTLGYDTRTDKPVFPTSHPTLIEAAAAYVDAIKHDPMARSRLVDDLERAIEREKSQQGSK